MKKLEKQIVAYTSVCHALVHILELTYGVVLIGIAQEFGTGLFVLGILANIAGFAFGLAALPAGFLVDRIGERRLLILFCLSSGIASIAVGLSPNIYVLAVALAVLGLALGIYHPVGSAFVAKGTTRRGIAFGYLGVGGNLGVALGPILAGVIAASLGWRAPYLVFAIPVMLMAALLYSFSRTEIPTVSEAPTQADTARTLSRPAILPLALIFSAAAMNGFAYRGLVTFLPLYLSQRLHFTFLNWSNIALAGAFTTVALIFGVGGLVTFLPLYLSQRLHFTFLNWSSIALAGAFTTVALIFGVGGQLLGGYLSERRRPEVLALVVTVAAVPLLLLMGNSEELTLMLAAIAYAFVHFMWQPISNNLIADYSPVSWQGRSYGISFFFGFGLGSFSATILGYIAERYGTNWIFIAMAGTSLIAAVFVVALLARALTTSRRSKIYQEVP